MSSKIPFKYTVYQTFLDECLKNISSITFISSAVLLMFKKCFQSNLSFLSYFINI